MEADLHLLLPYIDKDDVEDTGEDKWARISGIYFSPVTSPLLCVVYTSVLTVSNYCFLLDIRPYNRG
jgi:hypothetical protein